MISPIIPNPAPSDIENLPVPIFPLPIRNPPAITEIPPNDAIKIRTAKII
jgi:hypothetical protein